MPVAAPLATVFPDDLFEDDAASRADDGQWWVVYTKSRCEKALATAALQREVPFFLPLIKEQKLCRNRRYSVRVPLFPGYVFLYGTEEARLWSLTTRHVSRVLTVPDSERFTEDLGQIHRLIDAGVELSPERRLRPGTRVRIRGGSLLGMEGTVLKQHGETRLLVSVDFLQQGASIQVDDFLLDPIA